MSAFETLPPDQRAVLQLILKQGRGYADVTGLLKIDEAAVRTRAHAGAEALAPAGAGAALSAERRGQITDYLLGQQDDGERAVTLQHLQDSRAARRWANGLREQLLPLAGGPLPELPGAAANGGASSPAPAPAPAATPAQEPPARRSAARKPGAGLPDSPARQPRSFDREPSEPRRASKLGGLLLIGGVAALIVVIAVILINNAGGDDSPSASTAPAQTQPTRTTASRRAAADDTQILQQVNLRPPGGGDRPVGIAFILLKDQRPVVAVQVAGISANGQDDIYAAWLRQSGDGSAKFLGYVPGQVGRDGRFTVQADLPRDTARYDQIVVSRESIAVRDAPAAPASILLQGTIRLNRTG